MIYANASPPQELPRTTFAWILQFYAINVEINFTKFTLAALTKDAQSEERRGFREFGQKWTPVTKRNGSCPQE